MMSAPIIANVSLDEKVCLGASTEHRFRMVCAAMRLCFPGGVVAEIGSSTYTDPDGKQVHEPCAVVQIDTQASRAVFEDAITHISRSLGQECIAVRYPDGSGKCLGPAAEHWPFDVRFFVLPAAQLNVVAA